ncbi:MAG: TOBE domain-containing protein, partial [Candidatus Thiodiazotropha sp. (ex Semelilucina semeliformis)]|nr:TOBE domain-containing protein [Candidatus Thiodiazotropha sp. (ex Semelilucina semeliformis)]
EHCFTLPQSVMENYPDLPNRSGQMLLLGIRPATLTLVESGGNGSLEATMSSAEPLGHETILHVNADIDVVATDTEDPGNTLLKRPTLTAIIPGHRHFKPGETVHLQIDCDKLHCFDLQGTALAHH